MSSIHANIDEYSFEKLLLKLAQLHKFYFDPHVRDSIKTERLKKIEMSRKIVAFQNFVDSTKHKLQLYNTFPEKYSYLLPEQKIEWQKNKYYRLHEFLQDENSWFGKFQKEEAEILWCLFAYVDVLSNELPIKYLFGPANTEANENLNPHFLFRAYNIDSTSKNQFKSKEDSHLSNLANAAFYSRKKAESHKAVDFVWMLESNRKRTDFEIENSLMYVPSGEMDCCILQWLFLILKDDNPNFSLKNKVKPDLEKVVEIVFDNENRSKIKLPYEDNQPMLILEWMELWGLIKVKDGNYDIEKADFDLQPRAKAMLQWLSVYLKSLNCNSEKEKAPYVLGTDHEPNYWRVLALKDLYFNDKDEHTYLQNVNTEIQTKIINAFNESDVSITDEIYKQQFINMLMLILEWEENLDDIHGGVSWKIFHHRCRFSTFIHYINRFGEKEKPNMELSSEQSGLLAFPVLWDTVKEERYPVAFFMSIIKDTDKEGKSYFYNYKEDKVRKEFETKIDKIRTAIFLLAKVENIEVYQMGIRKHQEIERIEKETLLAITDSVHQIKTMMNGKFNPPLMSLLQDNNTKDDSRIKLLDIGRLTVIGLAEIINLISKLHQLKNGERLAESELVKGNLFTTSTEEISLNSIINELVTLRNLNKNKTEIKIIANDDLKINSNFLRHGNVSPDDVFFEIILLTAIENSIQHGSHGRSGVLEINVILSENQLEISNKAKSDANGEIHITGNFKLFQTLVHKLNIGKFTPSPYKENGINYFKITLESNHK